MISEVRSPHSDSPNERTRSPPYRATGWSCLVLSDASSYNSGYQRRWSQRHPILHNYGSVAAGSRTLPGNVFDDDIRPGPPLKFINISPLDLLVYILIYFAEGCFL